MIRINLLPHKKTKQAERGVQKLRMGVTALTLLVVLVLGYWFYSLASTLSELKEKEQLTNVQLQGLRAKLREVEGYEKSRAEFEQKLKIIQELEKRKMTLTPVLNEINALTTQDVWLTSLTLQGARLGLEGMCLYDRKGIDKFVQRLEGSPVFQGVTLAETKDAPPGPRGIKIYSFKLTGMLSGAAAAAPAAAQPATAPPAPAGTQQGKPQPPAPAPNPAAGAQPKPAPQPAAPKK